MKIAIISDMHFGYAWGKERGEESFTQGKEVIEKAVKEKVDFILLPGDIFDSRVPKQEIMERAMRILSIPQHAPKSNLKVNLMAK